MPIIIGITETASGYENYPEWISAGDDKIEVIRLTPANIAMLQNCYGIVLTGGVDSHPVFYGNQRTDYPNAPLEFDVLRDEFEIAVFKYALENRLPVLAVCRGMQLVNIALGGDIIQDIEESGREDHRRLEGADRLHEIAVVEGSLLSEITRSETGVVNSAHHQALGKLAPQIMINSYAADGIAEGAEWQNKNGQSFLLCVQWHPERLAQIQPANPFSKSIREKFIKAVRCTK
jgi:putative glutamine amidotransferase